MRHRRWRKAARLLAVPAMLGICGYPDRRCCAQQANDPAPAQSANVRGGWPTVGRALNATASNGMPTVVIITSPAEPASLQLCRAMATSPEIAALSGSFQFAEMAADIYKAQVQKLGVDRFPTLIVYRRGARGLEAVASMTGLSQPGQVAQWLGLLGLTQKGTATADPSVVRTGGHAPPAASGQTYPSQQAPQPAPPSKQPMAPPQPPYLPPPPAYAPPPVAAPPQSYMAPYPAPAPVYLQPPTPTMVVQQAPQQIVLAPAPPPQITVAMAPPAMPTVSYAPVGGAPPVGSAPPTNLFTQPAMAPPAAAPPAMAPPAAAPPYQPVMMAPVAMAPPAMAPPAQAPPQVGQGPIAATALAMTLTNPSLIGRVVGSIGEHFAQKKNPRVQMAQAPAMAPAPPGVAQAPIAYAPVTQAAYGYAPVGQAAVGYAPVGQAPYAYVPVTPEATAFAPCNTFRAPCKYHGGPCPGPGPQYAPPPPQYPAGSPQTESGYGYPHTGGSPQAPRKSYLSRMLGQ